MTISHRRLLAFPILVFLLISLLGAVFLWQLKAFTENIHDETLAIIKEETELVRSVLLPMLEQNHLEDAKSFCEKFNRDSLRLSLIHQDGTVIADSTRHTAEMENHLEREEVQGALTGKPRDITRQSASTGLWMTYYAVPIHLNEETYVIRTAVSTDRTGTLIRRVRAIFWLAMAIGASIVLILAWYILQRIQRPLVALQLSMDEIAAGNNDTEIPVPRTGMVRHIARHVEHMTACLKSQVEKMRRMEAFRREFLANVSHEIRTPLTSILGAAETLQEAPEMPAEQATRLMAVMCAQSRRLNDLVCDILGLSELEHRQEEQQQEFYLLPLLPVLQEAVDRLREKARLAGCEIQISCPESIQVVGDAQLLATAISNLINNAVKYSGTKSVEISVKEEGYAAVITCVDHGCGIAKEHWPRIFERFYRVSKERSRALGGTGLGLAIVKHIITLHHGNAEIQDTPGGGCTFTLTMPLNGSNN